MVIEEHDLEPAAADCEAKATQRKAVRVAAQTVVLNAQTTLENLVDQMIALRDKHSDPADSQYNEGGWDMAQRLISLARKASGWVPVETVPDAGGMFMVGGFVAVGEMTHFEHAFAMLIKTEQGPEWKHTDPDYEHVPIEYWSKVPAHPRYKKA